MADNSEDATLSLTSYLASAFPNISLPRSDFDPSKVMSRLQWFESLKALFQQLASAKLAVHKDDLLLALVKNGEELPLTKVESYFGSDSTEAAFSFSQVFWAVQEMKREEVTWDHLLDAMILLGSRKITKGSAPQLSKRSQDTSDNMLYSSLATNTVQSSLSLFEKQSGLCETLGRLKEERTSADNTLDLSYPKQKLVSYPEGLLKSRSLMVLSTQYITLAGNLLTHMQFRFPETLVILDLSNNQLQSAEFHIHLPNLRLLNLSHNRISRFAQMQRASGLFEVVISHNRLVKLSHLCALKELKLLDAGYNFLASFESIAGLSVNSNLMVLRLLGNPIRKNLSYEGNVRRLLPALQHLDPTDLNQFSEFEVMQATRLKLGPPSPTFHPTAAKRNWGQVDRIATPQHFHELTSTATLSSEKSYAGLISRLTPSMRQNGFWSSIGSARSSRGQSEAGKFSFPESPIRKSDKSLQKPRHFDGFATVPRTTRPKVPRLLLAKVLKSQI